MTAYVTSSRGLPGAAKRATMAGMRWHPEPTDDIWKQAHLAMVEGLGKRLWLSCDSMGLWSRCAAFPSSIVSTCGRRW
jgi:hypothetical protein